MKKIQFLVMVLAVVFTTNTAKAGACPEPFASMEDPCAAVTAQLGKNPRVTEAMKTACCKTSKDAGHTAEDAGGHTPKKEPKKPKKKAKQAKKEVRKDPKKDPPADQPAPDVVQPTSDAEPPPTEANKLKAEQERIEAQLKKMEQMQADLKRLQQAMKEKARKERFEQALRMVEKGMKDSGSVDADEFSDAVDVIVASIQPDSDSGGISSVLIIILAVLLLIAGFFIWRNRENIEFVSGLVLKKHPDLATGGSGDSDSDE